MIIIGFKNKKLSLEIVKKGQKMKFEQSIDISAKPETVFSTYTNVSKWPEWDSELEAASIDGDFIVGTFGKVKPKGDSECKIELTEVTQNRSFAMECRLPLCKMHFIHLMTPIESGTKVVNKVVFTGLLSPLFGRLIGKEINKGLPDSLLGLKQHIEKS